MSSRRLGHRDNFLVAVICGHRKRRVGCCGNVEEGKWRDGRGGGWPCSIILLGQLAATVVEVCCRCVERNRDRPF